MRLAEVQVRNFRNVLDSTSVSIQPDVTCLVGKNESGKTAFLHALNRLFPARENVTFSVPEQYPAWIEKRDRMRGEDLNRFQPVRAVFELDDADMASVADKYGVDVLSGKSLILARDYGGTLCYTFETDESAVCKQLLSSLRIAAQFEERVNSIKTLDDLRALASELSSSSEESQEEQTAAVLGKEIAEQIQNTFGKKSVTDGVWEVMNDRVPRFLYFSEYSSLPYTVKIKDLLKSDPKKLDDKKLTALSLLRLAAADDDYLLNPDYERRKRELENVANALTDDVLKYWSQNPELRVQPDITQVTVQASNGQQSVLDELKIRIWDQRHSLSLPFNEHSSGFQWFFSFLAAFAEYESQKAPVIILLDEPALGLHARAQADFLRFIDERLSARHQVIYTTHSPFMVQPACLERVRMVEDKGREHGAKVSADILSTDRDTLFPLQGALGYDLAQHLFIAPDNLIVEGTSDYTYLRVISDFLAQEGREALDIRWSIIPVGGADCVPTFIALLGQHLDVTVVIDARKTGHQRLSRLASDGYLIEKRIITIGQVIGKTLADVEDLFSPGDYLNIYNKAFGKSVKVAALTGTDTIVNQLARLEGVERFDHGRPADVFLRDRANVLANLTSHTLENFESLFRCINATLGNKNA